MKMVDFARKYWKFLGGVAVVAAILAMVFSSPQFISPKFTSVAVVYPANIGVYSGEERIDQFQQYIESNLIRDSLIKKFNLYEEYEIDPSHQHAKTYVNAVFAEHISFEKTRYQSIKIEVVSVDPQKAKLMADEIISLINYVVSKNVREKYKESVLMYKAMMKEKRVFVDSLAHELQQMSKKYGLLDYRSQAEEVTEGYMQFLLNDKKVEQYPLAENLYQNLKEHGAVFHNIQTQLDSANASYARWIGEYEEAKKNYIKDLTYSYVMVHPEVPDKKSSPIRWVIVLAAVLSAVGFTYLMMLILGYQKKKNV